MWLEEQEKNFNNLLAWKDLKYLPKSNGVYIIYYKMTILYIGESKNIWDRFYKHHRTGNNSSFRRIFDLYFPKQFLNELTIKYNILDYGRKELEEYLIARYNPLLNNPKRQNQINEIKKLQEVLSVI